MSDVITRFAPSPTGFMHIGGARTALFAWLWARKNNGTFILRIEDTDREREVPGSIAHIQESLSWLGLPWDYGPDTPGPFGPCVQSKRLESYRAAAEVLVEKGLAYPDPYTEEEIAGFRLAAQQAGRPFLYRDHRPERFETWDGTKPLRLKVPAIKRTVWHDAVRGDLEAGEEALDDFILIKSDGYPTYNFAHIVDDTAMGITHVMRGDEFISSTPKFLSLYDALGYEPPVFVTLPPILRDDKTKKLGKRDGAKDLLEYRAEGYLPEAMVNFLALIGWNPGTEQEIFSRDELIAAFEIDKIQTHGGVFNKEKLRWLNRQYLLRMPESEYEIRAAAILGDSLSRRNLPWDPAIAQRLSPLIRERIGVWQDLRALAGEGEFDFFFADPPVDREGIVPKGASAAETAARLRGAAAFLADLPAEAFADPGRIKASVWDYATREGRGQVLWPVRYALTGRAKSPDPFIVASVIGKEVALRRLAVSAAALEHAAV